MDSGVVKLLDSCGDDEFFHSFLCLAAKPKTAHSIHTRPMSAP